MQILTKKQGTLEIQAYGRVQGIRLRKAIQKKAKELDLSGYTLNRDDGSIFIELQGERAKCKQMLFWLEDNPGLADVRELRYQWVNKPLQQSAFTIVRKESLLADKIKAGWNLVKSTKRPETKTLNHLAIIPDGNRRWAKSKGASQTFGHYSATSFVHFKNLFEEAQKEGIKYFSLWGFSTENWKRDKKEIEAIFKIIENIVDECLGEAQQNDIRFRHIGRRDRIPKKLMEKIIKLEEATQHKEQFHVQLCLDYGGKDELIRATQKITQNEQEVTEKTISKALDTHDIPDPDLIIRTSGEQRLSGFMPFQSTYAELYFTQIPFPEFNKKELAKAIKEFYARQRRFGGN